MAGTQDFKLGIDHAAQIASGYALFVAAAMAAAGFVYIAENTPPAEPSTAITRLTAAGDRVVYQTTLGFAGAAMAVDAAGNVYAASQHGTVEKLSADGQTVVYHAHVGGTIFDLMALAADGQGRRVSSFGTR